MTATRILPALMPWFEEAVPAATLGEDVDWDLTFGIQNSQPCVLLYLQTRSRVLGMPPVGDACFIPTNGATKDGVLKVVLAAAERLFTLRTSQFDEARAAGNGSGLITGPAGPLQRPA